MTQIASPKLPVFTVSTRPAAKDMTDQIIVFVGADGSRTQMISDGVTWNGLTPAQAAATQALVSGSLSALSTGDTTVAAANALAIQAALNSSTTTVVSLTTPGIVYSNPIAIPTGKVLSIGAGCTLKRSDSVNAPLIKNKLAGQKNRANRFNRSANVVTVTNRFHGRTVGDLVWVAGLTDATMHGIQTVASVVDSDTWTYASTGTDGAGGVSTVFGSIIPLRRTIAGASFSSTSNVVTVSDPGHDLRSGMTVWMGTTGASTAFCGLVEVIAVWPDSWQYVTSASGTATATGTIAVAYDADIVVTGLGTIDGNGANNGTAQDVDVLLSVMHFGLLNRSRIDVKRAGSTVFRIINLFNATDTVVRDVEPFDTLVGIQWEGSAKRTLTQSIRGTEGKSVSGSQLIDDGVAFTGTLPAGATYDSTTSPYGLGAFLQNTVRDLNLPNCLNGVKQAGDSSVTFDQQVYEDIHGGMLSNNLTPLGLGPSGVRMVDDTNGLTGMVCGTITIRRVGWFGGANGVLWASQGSCKVLDIDTVIYNRNAQQIDANTGVPVWLQGGSATSGRIKMTRIKNIDYVPSVTTKSAIVFGDGNVKGTKTITFDEIDIEGYNLTPGNNQSAAAILKMGNATVLSARVGKGVFNGPASGTGIAIGCTGPDNMGRWILDGVRGAAGGTALGLLFSVANSDQTVCAGEIVLNNCDVASTSTIYDNGTNWTGTLTVRLNNSKLTPSGNLFNMTVATGLVVCHATNSVTGVADKVLVNSATCTFRLNAPSLQIDGNKVTAPQPGDIFWNTNATMTGSASVGMKARTAAGAWAALF